ncbi:MAG: 30S ribosomal protein S20 [Chlamydiales bacterium]
MAEEAKKRPTAEKRDIRNDKKRMINKMFKSQVRTTMRAFEEALQSHEKDQAKEKLNAVYSVADLGFKRGLYKKNKANRIKARAAARVAQQAS